MVLVRARYLVVDSQVEAVLRGHFSIEVPVDEEFPGGDVDAEHGVGVAVGDGVQQVAVEAEVPVVRVNLENKATLKSQMSRLSKVKGFLKPSQLSPPSKKTTLALTACWLVDSVAKYFFRLLWKP